ncbi:MULTISPECIES: ABC transporter ATP-binding protein [Neobacillus]|uniref:ABC transporter ATP-binding protein n=1 Tax=Neobacillus rhizophilus TaxID=2833579 RepID=A0A942U1B1_9BACI|nr:MULTISPECIES: ABC transporter ATP-binding protein [Neobacillus]MBS4212725.1 ABC transporter ATP-binding protein [Neobacillus rhizophilus]MBU8915153.1 ABC transporter ATP-binding protein [Bacillus sp. FJAT-29953]
MLLQISSLNVTLSGLKILQDVSLHINEGELVVVVGANGAGKSTLLRTITGLNPAESGSIQYMGKEIANQSPTTLPATGLCMVPEGRQLFPEMTAKENLLIGAYHYRKDSKRVANNLKKVYEMFPVLEKNADRIASTFSGGEQQMISIGRGLMSEPKILMIDELSLGLAPMVTEALFKTIKELNRSGISIMLIEQNARQALKIADRAYVMESGRIVMEGSGEELLNDDHVRVAYLGL